MKLAMRPAGMLGILALSLQTGLIVAQNGEFDAASVRHSVPGETRSLKSDSSRLMYTNVSLRDYLIEAFGVRDFQVSGPDWLVLERYDITATLPASSSLEDRNTMLQKLLVSRFGISMHRENRDVLVYALTLARNGMGLHISGDQVKSNMQTTDGGFSFSHLTVRQIVSYLTSLRLVDRPVVDQTASNGAYDVVLQLYPTGQELIAAMNNGAVAMGGPVAAALKENGFQLELKKMPFEMLIIDRAQKVPVGN